MKRRKWMLLLQMAAVLALATGLAAPVQAAEVDTTRETSLTIAFAEDDAADEVWHKEHSAERIGAADAAGEHIGDEKRQHIDGDDRHHSEQCRKPKGVQKARDEATAMAMTTPRGSKCRDWA